MIGIDTNILARHYTQDDPVQSPKATAFLQSHCTEDQPGWISVPVVCELFWVLRKAYRYPKSDVIKALKTMRNTQGIEIEDVDAFDAALELYLQSSADFPDCLIVSRHMLGGVEHTFTFDEAASKLDGFQLLA